MNRLADRCHGLEEEVDQYITAQDAYEQQLSSMAKSLSSMEEQLRQANQEKVKSVDIFGHPFCRLVAYDLQCFLTNTLTFQFELLFKL